jgi:hypothetical protein
MSPKQLAALALAAIALTAAGCGGSSKSQTTTTTASTPSTTSTTASTTTAATSTPTTTTHVTIATGKPLATATWITKGDAICARASARLATLHINTLADYARVLPQGAAYDRAEAEELGKLVPPAAKAHDWQLMIVAVENFAEDTSKAIPFLVAKESAAAQPLIVAGGNDRRQMAAIAKRNGFKVCSVL